ncbi:MAG: cysteine-rich small domain-containing protein [Clostridiales bacterium]|nr:cysteine-rich small domain-containing protein [Clostridiales bacterium]
MREHSARYFSNKDCAYYPCHQVENQEDFNCLFCYCPLYALGERCGGNFRYTDRGIKDCTDCTLPHAAGGYEHIMSHIQEVLALGKAAP